MSLRLRNKKWKDSTHMWTVIYQHHSKASLESFVIIFFSLFHLLYNYWGKLPMYIWRSKKSAFLIIEQKISCSFADVCNPRRKRPKLVSFLFILEREREREKPHHTFHDCCEHFFIFYWCINNDKKASKAMETIILAIYIFSSAMIIVLWTGLYLKDIASHDDPHVLLWRLLIFYLLCIMHAIIHETWAKTFCIIINLTNENCFLFMAWDYRSRLSSYKNLMRIRVHSHEELTLIITHDIHFKQQHNKHTLLTRHC